MKNNTFSPFQSNLKGSLILTLTALIWGVAFVAQSSAADSVPPFTFNAIRALIGAFFLFLVLLLLSKKQKAELIPKDPAAKKTVLTGGLVCGLVLTVSFNLQQFGIALYPAGVAAEARSGFLTALYVILVPLISLLFGKRIALPLLFSIAVAVVGIYLLCLSGGWQGVYLGDLLTLCCALTFALHILSVDKYVGAVGGVRLSMLQLTVCGVISAVLGLCFEKAVWENILAAAPQLLYLGIFSSGVAYTLQIIGQKFASPTVASLVMSLESVFAALGGWLILGNKLSLREGLGCALVFAAILFAQLPQKSR